MILTVLCKVVDNFGDIGVAWRLCRKLKANPSNPDINLLVDNLDAFQKINHSVDSVKDIQLIENINVYNWNSSLCHDIFYENDGEKLQLILELFQCGRPEWMEKILFEEKLQRTVHIIMIDYLTAEKYAEDFHCLQSLTRSSKVQKINFMPGFTNKTGGLILDDFWNQYTKRDENGPVLFFTYDKNWKPVLNALNHYQSEKNKITTSDTVPSILKILAARGKGFDSVVKACAETYSQNTDLLLIPLNFMDQTQWDSIMKLCSVLFIRGEESLTRACLSGFPFVWHAYPQSDEYQLVKVNALLERIHSFFAESDFEIIKKVWVLFNTPDELIDENDMENAVYAFLKEQNNLEKGFQDFAANLRKNGDLADNLMTFINKNYII